MAEVAAGELHENTDEVLRRVRAGEEITITVEGEPVAQVVPLTPRKKGLTFEELFRRLEKIPYDPEFAREMELASGEYSDEDPLPWDRGAHLAGSPTPVSTSLARPVAGSGAKRSRARWRSPW